MPRRMRNILDGGKVEEPCDRSRATRWKGGLEDGTQERCKKMLQKARKGEK